MFEDIYTFSCTGVWDEWPKRTLEFASFSVLGKF